MKMFKWLKKEWNKKSCFYKVIRTFLQTFALTFLTGITVVLSGAMKLSWGLILSAVLIPAISAGITAAVNLLGGKACTKYKENESENDNNE